MLPGRMDASRVRRSHLATIHVFVSLCATGVAAATAQEDTPVDIVYRAQGVSCPRHEEFLSGVQEALPASRAQQTRDRRQFTVILEDGRGVLEVRSKGGRSTRHEVRGSSCAEVGSALALSLALAIAPSGPPEVSPKDDSSRDTTTEPSVPTSAKSSNPKYAVGLAALGMLGPTPLALGGTLFYDLPHGKGQLIAPHVRVGAALLETVSPYESSVQSAAFSNYTVRLHWQWYVLRAELCGVHLVAASDNHGLRLCASMDAGYIVSQPSELSNARSSGNPWVAPGFGMRAFAEALGGLLELGPGLSFPLTRYRYFLDPSGNVAARDVYRVQSVGWTFSLGASYRFP